MSGETLPRLSPEQTQIDPEGSETQTTEAASKTPVYRIGAYFASWSVYARGYRLADFPGEKYTHLMYAFAQIGDDNRIALFDANADIVKVYGPEPPGLDFHGNFAQLRALKQRFPHLRILISVGGWTRSSAFSRMAATAESRAAFVESVVDFVQRYDFDGIDIDWEYPVEGGAATNERRVDDADNLVLLIRELRRALTAAYEISIAISPNPRYLAHLDLGALAYEVDAFNLMAYNYAGGWSATAEHQAPLLASGNRLSVTQSIRYCLDNGLPPDKLVVGIPAYGRGLSLPASLDAATVIGTRVSGPPPMGTWEGGSYDFRHIDSGIDEKRLPLSTPEVSYWDDEARAPYLYRPDGLFLSYDDARSVQAKSLAVWGMGLGGVMFWEASSDPEAKLATAAATVLGSPLTQEDSGVLSLQGNMGE